MKLDCSSSALVIVGGWNSHILNPNWINRYLFDGKEQRLKVEILAELPHSYNLDSPAQRVSSTEVKIQLQGNKLSVSPVEEKYFIKVEEIALKLADFLPHTPVSGFGVNFVYTHESSSDELVNIIPVEDINKIETLGATLISQQYTRSLELDDKILNLTIELKEEAETIKINFHYEINDLTQFKSKLAETTILDLKNQAIEFISKVYNLALRGDTE